MVPFRLWDSRGMASPAGLVGFLWGQDQCLQALLKRPFPSQPAGCGLTDVYQARDAQVNFEGWHAAVPDPSGVYGVLRRCTSFRPAGCLGARGDGRVAAALGQARPRPGTAPPAAPGPEPTFALYLLGRPPPHVPWDARWLQWPDFWLPSDRAAAAALSEAWARAGTERVEIACAGGYGRTGTALACLAVLDGLPARQAIAYVRRHYAAQAVETPWQRHYVARFR